MSGWAGDYLKVLLVVGTLWWGFYACGIAVDPGARDHFLGTSDAVAIDVVAVERVEGDCGKKTPYEITYTRAGSDELRTLRECRDRARETGPRDVWETSDGDIDFDDPDDERLWMLGLPFLFSAAVTVVRSRRRSSDQAREGEAA